MPTIGQSPTQQPTQQPTQPGAGGGGMLNDPRVQQSYMSGMSEVYQSIEMQRQFSKEMNIAGIMSNMIQASSDFASKAATTPSKVSGKVTQG